jgi:hypothetical protein
MPFTTLDALAAYYLTTRTSDGKGLFNGEVRDREKVMRGLKRKIHLF